MLKKCILLYTHTFIVGYQIEIFFSILQKRCLRYGNFKSENELKECMMKFIEKWNFDERHPFKWKFKGYSTQKDEFNEQTN